MKRPTPDRFGSRLGFESLESRQLLTSDWQNASLMRDVDGSNLVTPLDALLVINLLNDGRGPRALETRPTASTEPYCDVSGDGVLNPLDVLLIINALNKYNKPMQFSASISAESDPNQNGVVLSNNVVVRGASLEDVAISALTLGSSVTPAKVVANAAGEYQVSVEVPIGSHTVQLEATDDLGRKERLDLLVRHGDLTQDWNRAALDVIRNWTTTSNDPFPNRTVTSLPPVVARNLAMISTAMFDAANAVQQNYHGYRYQGEGQANASEAAAAATAAYHVAKALYSKPAELQKWEATLQETLGTVGEGNAKDLGVALGQQIANTILTDRQNDGSQSPSTYQPTDAPGRWNRTAPDFLPPLLPQWADLKPFVISDPAQFKPIAPPALTSPEYAAAVQEVMSLGSQTSTTRTEDQSQIAQFWADGSGTITPPGHWNQIATDVALAKAESGASRSVVENARMYALLNLALADAAITSWKAKYDYDFWRPIDAIREAASDGNSATQEQTDWVPLLKTPPFPSYTSGHSTFSGAAANVLDSIFGSQTSFTVEQDTQLGPAQRALPADSILLRSFSSFQQAANEAGMSRIYGGIHFNFDNTAGLSSGRDVGELVATTALQPKTT